MENTTPGAAPEAPKKKGLSPLAWIAIGCLVLLLLGSIAVFSCTAFVAKKAGDFAGDLQENPTKTIAQLAVKANPNLEVVSTDDDAGTMTIYDSESGKTVTLDFDDIAEGKFTIESEDGSFSVDATAGREGLVTVRTDEGETRFGAGGDLPGWVPRYPGARDLEIGYTSEGPDGRSGSYTFNSSDSVDEVLDWYRGQLTDAGFEVQTQTMPGGGLVSGEADEERRLSLILSSDDGATSATGTYSEGG